MELSRSHTELEAMLDEAFENLNNGRERVALSLAEKVYEHWNDDYHVVCCLAWAHLENANPLQALEYADLAVKIDEDATEPRLYRGFILMRMGIFDGALQDLNYVISCEDQSLAQAYHLKASCLAGAERYEEALTEFEQAIIADNGNSKHYQKIKEWFKKSAGIKTTFLKKLKGKEKPLIEEAEEAFKAREFWFSLWAARKILSDTALSEHHQRATLLELETMFSMFQYKPALAKAEQLKTTLAGVDRFEVIFHKLHQTDKKKKSTKEIKNATKEEPINESKVITLKRRTDFQIKETASARTIYAKTFDLIEQMSSGNKTYILQFNESSIQYIGVEVVILNPFTKQGNTSINGSAVWYLNGDEVGRHNFSLNVESDWGTVIFSQSWGTEQPGFWKRGQGKVDIYINGEKTVEKWFLVGSSVIIDFEEPDIYFSELESQNNQDMKTVSVQASEGSKDAVPDMSVDEILAELDKFTGLKAVKQAMRDFVDYLEFIKERKKLGLKTQEGISLHTVFLGNPGTGKTTIARLLGKVFKSMGLLPSGHLVEVDRSALVGQYIGETAQKTEKIISDSIGGLLFIDEAYTLVKKGGSGQDFGQEAIDTLLKRMEDRGSEFAVIAAGYPDEMNSFLESNPGMKSRFTHFFDFEDYTPDEMIEIFKQMAKKEDYTIADAAIEALKKELIILYRKRDKTFGNARLVRNLFNDAKMKLGKRYLKLPERLRDKNALTTITLSDIEDLFKGHTGKSYKLNIDEDNLKLALDKLNSLTGLSSVKKEIRELVKLARYYIEQGEDIQNRFSDHIVFSGNPGTGKTTVARMFSQIYSALGILPKGHLIEADRQTLVASYVGKTAEKTTELINQSLGGTLFIDEAYALVKAGDNSGSDFGKEAIDTLLKRMEDDRGKFIVIAAGYTDDMKTFLDSNVGLQSRFTKFINFEDYNPDELMVMTINSLKEKDLILEEKAKELLKKHFNEIYRVRDKTFGNARLIRNIVGAMIKNQVLRIVDIEQADLSEEATKTITAEDIRPIVSVAPEKKQARVEGNKELLDKYIAELRELTGLESVKRSVDKLITGLKVSKLREERGLKVISKNLHAVFLGNPGTGKTTVARLISQIFKELGLLQKGHLVEVDRSALVAGYAGQTAKKTDQVIEQALGGTLFIDEAYTLSRGSGDFGQEAIDTLLKRMEDYRDQLVVIVAGYPNEMRDFLDSNPGLQSRFTNYFNFEDYSPREMLDISTMISEKNGYHLDEGALQLLLIKFQELYENRDQNFGNARTVRNILYKAISNQEERILSINNLSNEALTSITFDDIENIDIREF